MMLGTLVYSCSTRVFSSHQIERLSYENVAVRVLGADTHPGHDTISTVRRQKKKLLSSSFAQVQKLAAQCEVFKVEYITVAIDGTKVLAEMEAPR